MSVPEPSDIPVDVTPPPDNVVSLFPATPPRPTPRDPGAPIPMTEAAIEALVERVWLKGYQAGQQSLTRGLRSV